MEKEQLLRNEIKTNEIGIAEVEGKLKAITDLLNEPCCKEEDRKHYKNQRESENIRKKEFEDNLKRAQRILECLKKNK